MSELAEIQPQQLTAVERSRNALRFEERKAELAELAKKSGDITVITNQDGRHQVHSARMRLKAARVGMALRLERAEADRIERERQKAEADRLAEESRLLAEQRAEIARKEAAELAEREEREIAAATLREAAREAVGLLCDSGQSHHIITRKLSAALHRELLP